MNAGRNGRHKTDNDFSAFPYDSKTRIRVIYEFRQWYKFDSGTIVDEYCYATKGGSPQIRGAATIGI